MLLVFIVVVIPGHNLGNSQVSVNRTIGPTLVLNNQLSFQFSFKLVVKLPSALSVNTVLAYRYFWISVKSIWSFLTLSIERPWYC